MDGGMHLKLCVLADVIGVAWSMARMIGWNEEVIETWLHCYDWIFCVKNFVGGFIIID